TLRTEIVLPNKDGRLRPAMYVLAQIISPFPESWTLPAAALVRQEDGFICFRIESDKAVRTPVQVGRGDGQHIQVLGWRSAKELPSWEEFTGKERILAKASGIVDGQSMTLQTAK